MFVQTKDSKNIKPYLLFLLMRILNNKHIFNTELMLFFYLVGYNKNYNLVKFLFC